MFRTGILDGPVQFFKEEKVLKKVIKVEGMKCTGCENRIKNVLEEVKEIENVKADFKTGLVEITTNSEVNDELIKEKINDLGFEVL